MVAIGLVVAAGAFICLARCAILRATGRPVRLPISSGGMAPGIKRANRVITYFSMAAVIVAYPLLRGQGPLAYFGRLLPFDQNALAAIHGFAAAVLYLSFLYVAWLATDNLRFRLRQAPGRLARRLAVAPFSAVLGALAEELLFRGVLLADLLKSLEPAPAATIAAVLFAGAHYVRPVKRHWTFAGHLALGMLLCTAFVWTGALWLPIGLHAGGILLTMGVRPFVRYTGPAWLVGASIFPYAGLAGSAALILLTANMWISYGGSP